MRQRTAAIAAQQTSADDALRAALGREHQFDSGKSGHSKFMSIQLLLWTLAVVDASDFGDRYQPRTVSHLAALEYRFWQKPDPTISDSNTAKLTFGATS